MKKFIIFSIFAVSTFGVSRSSSATCWTDMCLYGQPTYNQKSDQIPAIWFEDGKRSNSMLCAPTSAAMALQGLLARLAQHNVHAINWTKSSFAGRAAATQITQMALKMGTTVKGGTTGPGMDTGFSALTKDLTIPLAHSLEVPLMNVYRRTVGQINLASFVHIFRRFEAGMITSYGHYARQRVYVVTPTLKQVSKTYKRDGGHIISPRGYIGKVILFNDPWGGVVKVSELNTLKAKFLKSVKKGVTSIEFEALPSGVSAASTYAVYQDDTSDYFPIIDTQIGLITQEK